MSSSYGAIEKLATPLGGRVGTEVWILCTSTTPCELSCAVVLERYYVDEEYQELLEYLGSCIQEEDEHQWKPSEESGTKILQSANKVFFRIRSSLQRCAKFISRNEPLFLLSRAFQVGAILCNCNFHFHSLSTCWLSQASGSWGC